MQKSSSSKGKSPVVSKTKAVVTKSVKSKTTPVSFNINKSKLLGVIKSKKLIKAVLYLLFFFVGLILIDYGFQYLNNDYSAVVITHKDGVGTIRVSKRKVVEALLNSSGSNTAEYLTDIYIINDYATRNGISVSDIELEFYRFSSEYQLYGTLEEFRNADASADKIAKQLANDEYEAVLILHKVIFGDQDISEEEANASYEKYKESFSEADYNYFNTAEVKKLSYMIENIQTKAADSTKLEEIYSQYITNNNLSTKPEYGFLKSTKAVFNMFKKAE